MATETERKATADRAAGREAGAGAGSQAPASRPEGGCPLNPLLSLSKSGALSLIAQSFPSLRPATGRLPSIMLVQTSDGRAPRGVGEGRTGDLQLQRHFLSRYSLQARLPSRSASRHRPPEVLEPSCLPPLANLPIFGKKWTRLVPSSWFLPLVELAEDVGFTSASVQASMPLTP